MNESEFLHKMGHMTLAISIIVSYKNIPSAIDVAENA